MPELTPDKLIRKAKSGDQHAVTRLYELFYQGVYRYLYYRSGNVHTAEDLTSEVFIRMVKALPLYQAEKGSFKAWVYQIAHRISIDFLRSEQKHPTFDLSDQIVSDLPSPELLVERSVNGRTLLRAISALPEDQQEVLVLRFVNQLNIQETSGVLGRSVDSIKGLQRRALENLRKQLTENGVQVNGL